NPAMLVRWRVYLERTRKPHHPVFAPWHALAALPARDFAAKAAEYCATLCRDADPARPINPLVARALSERPPGTLAEAAQVYSRLLNAAGRLREEVTRRASLNGTTSAPLPVPALEELAQVFHGPDAPPELPFDPYGDLALLPDRPSQAKLQE